MDDSVLLLCPNCGRHSDCEEDCPSRKKSATLAMCVCGDSEMCHIDGMEQCIVPECGCKEFQEVSAEEDEHDPELLNQSNQSPT